MRPDRCQNDETKINNETSKIRPKDENKIMRTNRCQNAETTKKITPKDETEITRPPSRDQNTTLDPPKYHISQYFNKTINSINIMQLHCTFTC